ncbi:MAG: CinA family nicotinamide mononucleotide deamidase-related protein [Tannerellaceae bacterium]|nr:CinA family nicotinamide mononucleotide deamidase-related protein [Tannerellaceae bacterium]
MNIEIITIGDELLIGQVVDTNSTWIGQQVGDAGFRVTKKTTVGDVAQDIRDAIDSALSRVSIVLVTGGIGPTKDDITKKTLCDYFNCQLYFSEAVYQHIKDLLHHSGRMMNELNRSQAMVPDRCTIIRNEAGTAPCPTSEREGQVLAAMPGVPYEMKTLMTNEIIPRLKQQFLQDTFIRHVTLSVQGYTESALAERLAKFEEELPPFVTLAYLPQPGMVRLRVSAYGTSESQSEQAIEEQKRKLYILLEGHIFSEGTHALEQVLGRKLEEKKYLVGTAESCTGGYIASRITAWPGSSRHYMGSIVSYSNDIKKQVLGVSAEDLETYGAVSRQVVEQMVTGAIRVLGCDCTVATSGIAGPDGGTQDKPVGTIWIAAAVKDKVITECYHFGKVREQNIIRASNAALLMLLKML